MTDLIKRCRVCKIEQPIGNYCVADLNNRNYICSCCKAKKRKIYSDAHREEENANARKWKNENKEYAQNWQRQYRAIPAVHERHTTYMHGYNKTYGKSNRANISKQNRDRYATNLNYRLGVVLRGRLQRALRGKPKMGSMVRDLGCTVEELRLYLESKFQPGMSWDNWGRTGWHIDHIIPLSTFDLSNPEEFKRACKYTNLQPMWWRKNLQKGNRLE